ncbi:MAG: hypothetical protein FJ134_10420 [Deltaproteobacteria bacterium]|nr:hypothetical protein [Deltaproteobacteria bacterium]
MNFRGLNRLLVVMAALAIMAGGAYAATWNETGDAEPLLGTAQVTTGSGPLTQISGQFFDRTDVDLYKIQITDHVNFTAQTGLGWDPMLWLFNSSGLGVIADDDYLGGSPKLSKGTIYQPPSNGIYYLAISNFPHGPYSSGGNIFTWENLLASDGNYVSTPDGPGAGLPLSSWSGAWEGPGEPYTITLEGAGFADLALTPITGGIWLLGGGLAGLWMLGKRRKRLSA